MLTCTHTFTVYIHCTCIHVCTVHVPLQSPLISGLEMIRVVSRWLQAMSTPQNTKKMLKTVVPRGSYIIITIITNKIIIYMYNLE